MRLAKRLGGAAVLLLILQTGAAAQTMRFDTSVGSFDMELNPTTTPTCSRWSTTSSAYIGLGRYHYTAINRADEGFVLQMGGFLGFPPTPEDFLGLLQEIRRLDPVIVDANGDGQVDFDADAEHPRHGVAGVVRRQPQQRHQQLLHQPAATTRRPRRAGLRAVRADRRHDDGRPHHGAGPDQPDRATRTISRSATCRCWRTGGW